MKKLVKSGLAALTLAILAACGGGGDAPVAAVPPAADAPSGVVNPLVTTTPTGPTPTPGPTPPGAQALALALAAQTDQVFSAAVPATPGGAQFLNDGCYLSDGYTKAMNIAEIDANIPEYVAKNSYRIGSTRTNVRVVAERNITNADSSTRNEVDVLYDINYTDGSKDIDSTSTIVTGSTAGLCATPQNSTASRFLGNQRMVGVAVRARNERVEQYDKATSAPNGNGNVALYVNSLQFAVSDPQGRAAYAIVTGPGSFNINGVTTTFSVKLLSTRLLKSDPLLDAKNGNYANWKADDTFRFCRTSAATTGNANSSIPASATDCTLGASGNTIGRTLGVNSSGANAFQIDSTDQSFARIGFVAGGTYTFKIYNDDGWKTANGEVGKTPIAMYTAVNDSLPYTLAQMVGTNGIADHKFAKLTSSSLTPAQTALAISSSLPSSLSIVWSAPVVQADARAFRFTEVGEFFQGAKTGNPSGFFPAERYYKPTYFTGNTTAANSLVISGTPSTIQNKSYAEFSLNYTDRNGGRIASYITFQ